MKGLKVTGILIMLSLLISCKSKNKDQASKEKPPALVEVMVAGDQDFSSRLEVNGSVLSYELVELHPEISGRITYLNIPDGATVTEGSILAKINDADMQAQKEQLQIQLELAKKTESRLRNLLKVNGVNQADYDAALSQVNTLQANIKVLDAQLDKTVIRAPFTGQLGLREVSPGAYVTPQTLIATLQQSNKVKIDFTVPETFNNLVKKGNKVHVETADVDTKILATIVAVEPQVNSTTRNIKVRAVPAGGNLLPGSFVKILLDQNRKVIVVPTNAIIPDAFQNQVVLVKNNKAVFTNVETGSRNENMVELTGGIQQGDSIVISGMLFVRPNGAVKVKKVRVKADKKN
ncbi:MAG: efflux RND transporter periplasmic adaptor subunit [Bacteroidetes bacterium]|nr:efflux RND transporter periplasmic adaptor subunit [Bacteroidota bacterium]